MLNVTQKSTYKKIATFSFSMSDVLAYRAFSKDENPVHLDGVIFGIQLMGKIEYHLLKVLNKKSYLAIDYTFSNKVYVDEPIDLYFTSQSDFLVLSLNKSIGSGRIKFD